MRIEERAERFANVISKGCNNTEKQGRYIGYIEGAIAQRDIDIEKVVSFICTDCKQHYKGYCTDNNCTQIDNLIKTIGK